MKARGILPFVPNAEDPAVTIRRMRDNDMLGMGAMLESMTDRAVVDVACQNCGTHFNVNPDCDVVRCPKCRVRFHAKDLSPWGCHDGDSEGLTHA